MCWRHINEIYGISQVIGLISVDQGIYSFISRLVVVLNDEIMIITVLGKYFVVTKSYVNIFLYSDSIVVFFFKKDMFFLFLSFSALNNFV